MNKFNLNFSNTVFLLISISTLYILIYNVLHYNPILGYDAEAHFGYVDYLSRYLPNEFRLPSKNDTREFFNPPLAYIVPSLNPLCDGAALEALKLISNWLEIAFDDPKNVHARGGMLIGSCFAGVAFTKGLGLVHSISHMIGAEFNTQHGLTNAIILPAVMRFNLPTVQEKLPSISNAMGLNSYKVKSNSLHFGIGQKF